MVIGPATNDWIQLPDQVLLAGRFVRIDNVPDFLQEVVRVLPRRLNQQFAAVFPEILSKEVESLVDMRDERFLRGELQAPLTEKLLHQGPDFIFQHFSRRAGNHEVVGIPYQVDLGAVSSALDLLLAEALVE